MDTGRTVRTSSANTILILTSTSGLAEARKQVMAAMRYRRPSPKFNNVFLNDVIIFDGPVNPRRIGFLDCRQIQLQQPWPSGWRSGY